MTSAVTRIGGRNVNMGHFISYVFTEGEIIMHDEKTVKRKTDENLSSNFKFQGEVYTVTYYLDHSSLNVLDEWNNFDWSVTKKQNEYISKLFNEKSYVDLGVLRLESLKTLYYKTWVHSETMCAIFRFISKKRYGVKDLSFIVVNDNTGEFQIET